MTRAQYFGAIGAALLAAWYAALTHIELSPSARPHVVAAPAYAIAAFALYSLVLIAHSVVFFPSCASEASSLARDVSRARDDLLAAGVLEAEDFVRTTDDARFER